jgi:hypothetical protein
MRRRPLFDPASDYSRDLAESIMQARIPQQAHFCIAVDADGAGGICGRPSSPADPGNGCVKHPTTSSQRKEPRVIATLLFYKETLFDANRDLMVGYLVSEGGTPVGMAREMVGNAWDVWTARLCEDNPALAAERAQRIINEAIGFLCLAGRSEKSYGSSREVDLGWHVMLSDTRVYAALCHVVAGHFVHHDADDLLGRDASGDAGKCQNSKCQMCGSECRTSGPGRERRTLRDTVAAMREIGPVDAELWPVAEALEPV